MKPKDMLAKLEELASALSVKVSYESLSSSVFSGGLCRVKNRYRIILDKRMGPEERVTTLAKAVGALPGADNIDIKMHKDVRAIIDYYAMRQAS